MESKTLDNICPICKNELKQNSSGYYCELDHYVRLSYDKKFKSYYELMLFNGFYFDNDFKFTQLNVTQLKFNVLTLAKMRGHEHADPTVIKSCVDLNIFTRLSNLNDILNKINFLKNFS